MQISRSGSTGLSIVTAQGRRAMGWALRPAEGAVLPNARRFRRESALGTLLTVAGNRADRLCKQTMLQRRDNQCQ